MSAMFDFYCQSLILVFFLFYPVFHDIILDLPVPKIMDLKQFFDKSIHFIDTLHTID